MIYDPAREQLIARFGLKPLAGATRATDAQIEQARGEIRRRRSERIQDANAAVDAYMRTSGTRNYQRAFLHVWNTRPDLFADVQETSGEVAANFNPNHDQLGRFTTGDDAVAPHGRPRWTDGGVHQFYVQVDGLGGYDGKLSSDPYHQDHGTGHCSSACVREAIAELSKMAGSEKLVDLRQIEREIRVANPLRTFDFTDANTPHAPAIQDLPPVLLDHQVVPQRISIDQIASQLSNGPILVSQNRGGEVGHAQLIIRRDPDGTNDTYNPLILKGEKATLADAQIDHRLLYALFPGNNLSAVVHVAISELTGRAGKNVDVPTPAIAEQFRQQPGLAGSEKFAAPPGLALPILRGHGVDAQAIRTDELSRRLAAGPVLALLDAGTTQQHTVLLLQDNGVDKTGQRSYRAYDAAAGGGAYLYAARLAPAPLYALTLARHH